MGKHGRIWQPHHVAAGYDQKDWGPPPTKHSQLIGTYQGSRETITVRLLPLGHTGVAELEIQWGDENGPKVSVVNEETALLYLVQDGAVSVEAD